MNGIRPEDPFTRIREAMLYASKTVKTWPKWKMDALGKWVGRKYDADTIRRPYLQSAPANGINIGGEE